MDDTDKKIIADQLAKQVGKIVSSCYEKGGLDEDVSVEVSVETPTCYFDENGVPHNGRIVIVDVGFSVEGESDED